MESYGLGLNDKSIINTISPAYIKIHKSSNNQIKENVIYKLSSET